MISFPSAVDSRSFASLMLMLTQALSALFITELIARAKGQTTCAPLMQSLLQQTEATNGYGSWDACCAQTGIDCYLTRQAAPPGYEPCDATHGARAGCNRLPQGTVCMIGEDELISGSPCGVSVVRSCGNFIALGGNVTHILAPFSNYTTNVLEASASILAHGVLESSFCCSTSACTFTSPCTLQYNMSACVSDGVNFICIPLDQPNDTTYAVQIDCLITVTPSTYSSSPTSTTPQTGGRGRKPAIIGGSVGGAVAFIFIAALSIVLFLKIRGSRTSDVPANEWIDHQGVAAVTNQVAFFPDPKYTPSFPSHPSPQWTSSHGNLCSFSGPSHQNRNAFEFPANPQNPSQVYQDPGASIISRPTQNSLEFLANHRHPSQGYQDPRPSVIAQPAFQPSTSPPPPFYTADLPSSAVDTQTMEARIAALETRIMALSGPSSGVQVGEPETGVALELDGMDPPRYDDKE